MYASTNSIFDNRISCMFIHLSYQPLNSLYIPRVLNAHKSPVSLEKNYFLEDLMM